MDESKCAKIIEEACRRYSSSVATDRIRERFSAKGEVLKSIEEIFQKMDSRIHLAESNESSFLDAVANLSAERRGDPRIQYTMQLVMPMDFIEMTFELKPTETKAETVVLPVTVAVE